jgi:hypothetical protein
LAGVVSFQKYIPEPAFQVISFGHVISAKIDCENLQKMNFTQGIP